MSKTIAAALCETNQLRGLPQENVYIQNLYRTPADYSAPFQRSASSTAPVQICAVASAQGDDTIAAMALQEVMKILQSMTAQAQKHSVLNFESFSGQFLSSANAAVCNLSAANHGSPVRVSITMLLIEGDTMRIISVGNTRAVLVRQGRVITLSEDQTVAHRYVQLGALTPDAENTHPERSVLTQYIGKFQQDGPVLAEKQIYMKIMDGDELCLLGTGIAQGLSDYYRNAILISPAALEIKANDIIGKCSQNGVQGGLSVLILKIENTLVVPAGGFVPPVPSMINTATDNAITFSSRDPKQGSTYNHISSSSLREESAFSSVNDPYIQDPSEDNEEDFSNMPITAKKKTVSSKKSRNLAIIRPIAVFLGCILVGYLGVMLLFNVGDLMRSGKTIATDSNGSTVALTKVMYVNAQMVAVYPDPSLNNTPTVYLNRGDAVTFTKVSGSFSEVTTADNVSGYIISKMLSDSDPTIGESEQESADPTPIPSKEQTAVTTSKKSSTEPDKTTAVTSETKISESNTVTPTAGLTPSITPGVTPSVTPNVTPDGTSETTAATSSVTPGITPEVTPITTPGVTPTVPAVTP
jgi:serine/threonine protein phosphatase PrpC